ncbi:Usher syndrome type-1G protein [Nilaparvata lugens]|uniref:Usher syndrome type-1G protein n=1 Tax=Nilaparvata lugens TaxID=108931 RepID=UPI00193EA9FC|nr:Usher syndrome type-1G protein [Nilaparvata lugens]
MSNRFHKAAQDGMLEILREATKRDCNAKDEDGMTPTLWAAYEGNLDALRLLVGRGGDPEKCNYHFGQSGLHLAAARGHLPCVTFLVAFGVNVWQLDHDSRTPMQLAAAHSRHAVLDYLDKAAAKQEVTNKREAKLRKEKAQKDAERHRRKYEERMKKEREKEEKRIRKIKKVEKEILGGHKIEVDTPIPTTLPSRKSVIEVTGPSFTQIVGAGTLSKKPAVQTGVKKIIDRKLRATSQLKHSSNDIRVDPEPNKIIHTGQRKDSQIIYVNSYDAQNNGGKRGRIADVFDTKGELIRSISQPDYLNSAGVGGVEVGGSPLHEQASIFDRPGFGSVAFRQRNALAGTLSALPALDLDKDSGGEGQDGLGVGGGGEVGVGGGEEDSSIGSAGSLAKRNQVGGVGGVLHWQHHHADIDTSDEDPLDTGSDLALGDTSGWSVALKRFLVASGCGEWWPQLVEQRIDLDALLMLSDGDLVQLGMPMGPRRKLMHQCRQRRQAIDTPGDMHDSRL